MAIALGKWFSQLSSLGVSGSPSTCHAGWWFGTFGLFFHSVGNFIIPTDDSSYFSEGYRSTTDQMPFKFPLDPIKPPLKIPWNNPKIPLNHHFFNPMKPPLTLHIGPAVISDDAESPGLFGARGGGAVRGVSWSGRITVKTWEKIRETTSRIIGLQDVRPIEATRCERWFIAKAPVTGYLNHSDIVIVINQSDIGVM